MTKGSKIAHASTRAARERDAVDELCEQLGPGESRSVLFYCSAEYDLERLAQLLTESVAGTLIGCTSAGQLGPQGFQRGGISALAIDTSVLDLQPFLLSPLSECQVQAAKVARQVEPLRAAAPDRSVFGLLLVDGMSKKEERLAASLYHALEDLPIVGGSAGDDLAFEQSYVFYDGKFHDQAALFVLARSASPFLTFKFQHFVPTDTRLVVTDADVEQRIVRELNGEPAAQAYAEAIGARVEQLDANLFSQHPLLVNMGGEFYVRSIAKALDDGALATLCAIEQGVVLSIGKGVDVIDTVERAFAEVRRQLREPALVLGFDCILRRLEFENRELDRRVGDLLGGLKVFGFSTYGETFNAVHVNQTFTGVAIGERR